MNIIEPEKKFIAAIKEYGIDYSSTQDDIRERAKKISIDNVSLAGIRAALMSVGKIIEENTDEGYYIAIVSPGSHKAVILATVSDTNLELMAYAKEGIIKRNTAERAIKQILDECL